jgi:hypothetical protein
MIEINARYTPTIMDGPVIRFEFGISRGMGREIISGEERDDFSVEISASRNGVSMNVDYFPVYSTKDAIEEIQKLFGTAWNAYCAIRSAGHGGHDEAKRFVERFNTERQALVGEFVASEATECAK